MRGSVGEDMAGEWSVGRTWLVSGSVHVGET